MKRPRSASSTGAAKPPARHDSLSGEEKALWRHVATSVEPIKAKSRVTHGIQSADGDDNTDERPTPARRAARTKASASDSAAVMSRATRGGRAPADTASPPDLADFDPRKVRKLSRGRAEVDARIDLHGLRQDEAHLRLVHFLRDAHARGHKTVLVITGKGRVGDDAHLSFADSLDRQPRGVLRRNVPRWLEEPDLRAIVVSYAPAAQRHGGEGALYVELRRRPR